MTNKFVDKMKYGIAGLATLALSYLPIDSYSQTINKGVSFGVNKIGGEEYKKELTIAHGTPYIFSEVKTSDENSLGVEATPYLMEKAGKRVVYVPKEMNVERIVLKQDGPFGIKGDKNTFTFDYFMNNKNPMGDNVNHTEKNYSRNISTMILPSGDTTYFIYDTTDKDAVANGKKLNFTSVVVGDSVKSDDKGNLYIQSNKGKVYEWVLDESRTNSPTSIDKKVIDTTYFSVIKSNKELTGFKKYETNVAQGEYETIVSGVKNQETKYTVVNSPTELKSLDNAGFKRTYCKSNKHYTYTIESDKVKTTKIDKTHLKVNGVKVDKKSVTSKTENVKVPNHNKVKVSGMIYEYTVPVEDLKNLKYDCDSCGASSKYKIDTTNVTENLVLNPGYPSKYLNKFGTNTTGEVEKIILSDGPAKKPAKEKKLNFKLPSIRGIVGVDGYVGGIENPTGGASLTGAIQVQPKEGLWVGVFSSYTPNYFSTKTNSFIKSQTPKTSLLDIDGNVDGIHTEVYDKVDSSWTTNSTIKTPLTIGVQTNYSLGENSELEVKLGMANKKTSTAITGTKDIYQYQLVKDGNNTLQEVPLTEKIHLESERPVVKNKNEWISSISVGYNHRFGKNKNWAVGVSGTYAEDLSTKLSLMHIIGKNEK